MRQNLLMLIMESTSISLWCAHRFFSPNNNPSYRQFHAYLPRNFTRSAKIQCSSHYVRKNFYAGETKRDSGDRGKLFDGYNSSTRTSESLIRDGEQEGGFGLLGISSKMWLGDLKSLLGQRINLQGFAYGVRVLTKDREMALPQVRVPDVSYVDWAELKNRGFEGVVFDKDNTITAPYSLTLWPPLKSSINHCKSVFGNNLAVFSNSAGLYEYDPDGVKASAIEDAIGINVIRHKAKKPSGGAGEIERHFGCESSRLIMVGDRLLTDIVYGNRNGFFTILTEPLSFSDEPLIVRQARRFEMAILNHWSKKGLRASHHKLISDPHKCFKDPSVY